MTRARNLAGLGTVTAQPTTTTPVHLGPLGVGTFARIYGTWEHDQINSVSIGTTQLQISGITTGLNVSGIITAQNGLNLTGNIVNGLNVSAGISTFQAIQATDATFSGTVTYEDLTDLDSIGVGTFRKGIIVAGVGTFSSGVGIADSIFHIGDEDTQIRFPAADTFTAETGGTERFRINSSGNVSIGNNPTVAASTLFHVEKADEVNVVFEGNTTTLGARLVLKNNNTDAGAYNALEFADAGGQSTSNIIGYNTDQTNNYGVLAFQTRSAQGSPPAERMRLDKDGRLLLGTTTEGHANGDDLTIATSGDTGITLRSGTSGAGNIYFSDATSGTGEYEGFISYGHNVNGMYFATSQSTRMFISSAGLIGINNTSPAYQLDCVGDGGGSFSASTNSTAGQLSIVGKNSGGAVSAISRIKSHPDGSSNQSHMAFETRNSSNTMVEAVRITSAQSVGIGTNNPNRKFTLYNDTTTRMNLKSLATSTVGIEFGDPADENIGYIVYDNTDDSMSFGANAGQKVKIDGTNTTFTNGILIGSSDLTKTQDGIMLQRNNSSGDCQIICGRSGGNYTGLEHYVAGASGVTKRHSIDYQSYHKWFAADGTTTMMTLASDNDLSIGTTNHTSRITINTGSISNAVSIRNTTGGNGVVGVLFSTQDHSSGREKAAIFHQETHGEAHYGGDLLFCLNSATGGATQVSVSDVRMRVRRDGNVMIAKAPGDAGSGGVTGIELYGGAYSMFVRSSGTPMYVGRNSSTGEVVSYMYNGTARGTVTTDGTVVAYNTSSDYRLKENEVAITNSIEKIKQLKPYTFNFKETPNKIDQGFFAHEVQSVIPGAVTGTKDSVHSSDDDKNNIKAGDIDPQQLDYAKLTPLLTAALQEAIAEIETLKSEVAALKGS